MSEVNEKLKEACLTVRQCSQMRKRFEKLRKGESCDDLKITNPTIGLVDALEDMILQMYKTIENEKMKELTVKFNKEELEEFLNDYVLYIYDLYPPKNAYDEKHNFVRDYIEGYFAGSFPGGTDENET